MRAWSRTVDNPFRDNGAFWRSIAASVGALATFVLAVLLHVTVGAVGAVAYVVPAALLVLAAVAGRASSAVTRPTFATDEEWREAERRAVAAALWPVRSARTAGSATGR